MKDFIVARKVKAYRVVQCTHCNQFLEVDLSLIFGIDFKGSYKVENVVCPWCDHTHKITFNNMKDNTDRIVRYD